MPRPGPVAPVNAILATVIPVHQIMPEALANVLRATPLTPDKIDFAWRTVVGPAVARATTVALHGHTLHVEAQEATWQREVERSAGVICARLKPLLGDNVVRCLEVTVA